MMLRMLTAAAVLAAIPASAAVSITIEADSGRIPISPWLYGTNNEVTNTDPAKPEGRARLARLRDMGVRVLRENNGNNASKYNWRKKLSSHPDWFNNVYAADWDARARLIQDSLPGTQGLFAFQLLGKAAANTANNWGDWAWAQAHQGTYPPIHFDLAGGGAVSDDGSTLTQSGDASKYLTDWPADSTTGIIGHWFAPKAQGGLGLDSARFRYWNMDNEPDIWSGTHDDVEKDTVSFESYFARYLAVAKTARQRFPSVRLVGPVLTNEWQWWTWNNKLIDGSDGEQYTPMEYFLKRIGEEERKSGMRLLDVFDLHCYPGYNTTADAAALLQFHRMFYDTTYAWPKSNGIHMIDGKWNKAVPNYLFKRIERWMETHLGAGRASLAITEFGATSSGGAVPARAAFYASLLGTFADHGVEILTPWDWYTGWDEVLHLYSRHGGTTRVQSRSTLDSLVSAYSSLVATGDTLAVVLVNRDLTQQQTASLDLRGFTPSGAAQTLRLANLPATETFVSHTQNALQSGTAAMSGTTLSLALPPLSITMVRIPGLSARPVSLATAAARSPASWKLQDGAIRFSHPVAARLYDLRGREMLRSEAGVLSLSGIPFGRYVLRAEGISTPVVWIR